MRLGLGLHVGGNAPSGIAGDLYPDALIAFDPVNSWYKASASFGTDDLAAFLAHSAVHYSSDPTAGISASGYAALDAYDLYVDWAGGNDIMVLVDAIFLPIPDDDDADQLIWAGVTNANGGQYIRAGQTDFSATADAPRVYCSGNTASTTFALTDPVVTDGAQIRLAFGYDGTIAYQSWGGVHNSASIDLSTPPDKIWLGDAPNEVPGGTVKRILVYPAWDDTVANEWTDV